MTIRLSRVVYGRCCFPNLNEISSRRRARFGRHALLEMPFVFGSLGELLGSRSKSTLQRNDLQHVAGWKQSLCRLLMKKLCN